MECITIRPKQIETEKKENCKFINVQVLLLMLFPFFVVRNAYQYSGSSLSRLFEAYETLGALFCDVTDNTLELSVTNRIWELILDTILEIAEMISADASEHLSADIDVNPKFR